MFCVDTFRLHQEKCHGVTPTNFPLKFQSLLAKHLEEDSARREKWASQPEDEKEGLAFTPYGYAVAKVPKRIRKMPGGHGYKNRKKEPKKPLLKVECKVKFVVRISNCSCLYSPPSLD